MNISALRFGGHRFQVFFQPLEKKSEVENPQKPLIPSEDLGDIFEAVTRKTYQEIEAEKDRADRAEAEEQLCQGLITLNDSSHLFGFTTIDPKSGKPQDIIQLGGHQFSLENKEPEKLVVSHRQGQLTDLHSILKKVEPALDREMEINRRIPPSFHQIKPQRPHKAASSDFLEESESKPQDMLERKPSSFPQPESIDDDSPAFFIKQMPSPEHVLACDSETELKNMLKQLKALVPTSLTGNLKILKSQPTTPLRQNKLPLDDQGRGDANEEEFFYPERPATPGLTAEYRRQ